MILNHDIIAGNLHAVFRGRLQYSLTGDYWLGYPQNQNFFTDHASLRRSQRVYTKQDLNQFAVKWGPSDVWKVTPVCLHFTLLQGYE